MSSHPTVCVIVAEGDLPERDREAWRWGGHFDTVSDRRTVSTSVDSVREQKKLEARKMLENRAESRQPALSLSKGPVHALLGVVELEDSLAEKDITGKPD